MSLEDKKLFLKQTKAFIALLMPFLYEFSSVPNEDLSICSLAALFFMCLLNWIDFLETVR